MADKIQYDYRLCEVRDRKGDLDKRWYVEFWVWDVGTDSLVRKVDYIPAKFKTAPERYTECLRLKKAIDRELVNGAFIDSSGRTKKKAAAKPMTIIKAVEWFRSEHSNEVGERAQDGYRSFENIFIEYLRSLQYDRLPLSKLDQEMIYGFLGFLINERGVGNRTRNNYLTWLNTMFNYLVGRKILTANPAKEIKKLKTSSATPHSL